MTGKPLLSGVGTPDSSTAGARPRRHSATAVFVLLAVGILGFWLGLSGQSSPTGTVKPPDLNAELEIDRSFLDLGRVWREPRFKWELPITNVTQGTLTIKRFFLPCNCASINPTSLTVAPGATASVKLTIDLRSFLKESSKGAQPFSFPLSAYFVSAEGVDERVTQWTLRGQVDPRLSLSPSILQIDKLIAGHIQPAAADRSPPRRWVRSGNWAVALDEWQ